MLGLKINIIIMHHNGCRIKIDVAHTIPATMASFALHTGSALQTRGLINVVLVAAPQ